MTLAEFEQFLDSLAGLTWEQACERLKPVCEEILGGEISIGDPWDPIKAECVWRLSHADQ